MDRQGRRRTLRGFFLKDLRGLSLVLLGAAIYLLLFAAFGVPKIPSLISARDANFPRKIWQSWKVDPLSMEERDGRRARSWIVKNPSFRYEVLTDDNGLAYVQQVFGPAGFNRPDVVKTYESLNAKIIQADLLRYIVMYAEGGIYADIDVEAIKPFSQFIPERFNEQDLDMIIGIETDEPDFRSHPILGVKAQSFCQWVFVCKPRLPVMMKLIDSILIWLNRLAEKQSQPISALRLDFDEVLNGTGPSAFTAALLSEMTESTGRQISWDDFHDLQESKAVARTLVLPSEAFAAGTGHSDSGNHHSKRALAKHHFHASSWTIAHPRFKHPVYGEVERCNWDGECVKLWDLNTAFFDALPEQDRLKMIALKEIEAMKTSALAPEPQQDAQLVLDPQVSTESELVAGPEAEAEAQAASESGFGLPSPLSDEADLASHDNDAGLTENSDQDDDDDDEEDEYD